MTKEFQYDSSDNTILNEGIPHRIKIDETNP